MGVDRAYIEPGERLSVSIDRTREGQEPAMRVGVVSNPRAGRNAARASEMAALLTGQRDVAHVATDDPDNLPGVLKRFADEGVGLLIVNGGDGTLQQVLTVLLTGDVSEGFPLVAPLRGGRTNMSAIDIGCQPDSVKALGCLIETARSRALGERIVDRSVLRIDMGPDDGVQYGMFCGVGVIHRAVDLIHRAFPPGKRSRGALGAGVLTGVLVARAALRSASGILTPDRIEVLLDGQPVLQQEFQLAITTTLGRLFLQMQPFWGQEAAPVRVTTIAASARRKWLAAVGILRGRPRPHVTPSTGYTSRNVRCAELHLDCGLCVDGELFAPRRDRIVRIEADSRIRFVRG